MHVCLFLSSSPPPRRFFSATNKLSFQFFSPEHSDDKYGRYLKNEGPGGSGSGPVTSVFRAQHLNIFRRVALAWEVAKFQSMIDSSFRTPIFESNVENALCVILAHRYQKYEDFPDGAITPNVSVWFHLLYVFFVFPQGQVLVTPSLLGLRLPRRTQ